jgi:hypothetical protein
MILRVGRDSVVSKTTHDELDGLGIESRWGRFFPHPSRPAVEPTQPPVQWVPGFFHGVERLGRSVDHPPSSSTEVNGRVKPYLYYPWVFMSCLGVTLGFSEERTIKYLKFPLLSVTAWSLRHKYFVFGKVGTLPKRVNFSVSRFSQWSLHSYKSETL